MRRRTPRRYATRECIRAVRNRDVRQAADYLNAKSDALRFRCPEKGRAEATRQLLEVKSFKPGLGEYKRKKQDPSSTGGDIIRR